MRHEYRVTHDPAEDGYLHDMWVASCVGCDWYDSTPSLAEAYKWGENHERESKDEL